MADLMPDYSLERAGIELEIAQLTLNIQSMQFRKLQLASETKQIDTNIEATRGSIEEKQELLKGVSK